MVLLKSLARAGFYYGIAQFILRGEHSRYDMQQTATRIVTRIALVVAGMALGFIGLLLLLGALFFYLADAVDFVRPAIITALVIFAVAIALFWRGVAVSTRR